MANDEHLRRAFLFFDKDGNGFIEPEELREALVDDGAADSMEEVVNDILQEVDTDKVTDTLMSLVGRVILVLWSSDERVSSVSCPFTSMCRTARSATRSLWR
jgi:hypothetical protein